jgi:hypothetical protein
MIRWRRTLGAACICLVLLIDLPSGPVEAAIDKSGWPNLCTAGGRSVKPEVDLLLLLDNSSSLELTDPTSSRFESLRDMFGAIGEESSKNSALKVYFAAAAFGTKAEMLIEFSDNQVISTESAVQLADELKTLTADPSLRLRLGQGTNYINALDLAIPVLANRPKEHCRILIWFTDGMFTDGRSQQKTIDALQTLTDKVCKEGGWADQVRELEIHPFVLLLEPNKSKDSKEVARSYEVMTQLTGDPSPPEGFAGQTHEPCSGLKKQVGEVFRAKDATELRRYFEIIILLLGGHLGTCPIASTSGNQRGYVSSVLPPGRFLRNVTLIAAAEGTLPAEEKIRATMNGKDAGQPMGTFVIRSSTQIDLSSFSDELIDPWQLVIDDNMSGACIFAKLIDAPEVKLEKSGSTPAFAGAVTPTSPLTSDDLASITFHPDDCSKARVGDCASLTPDEALVRVVSGQNVKGHLDLKSEVFPDGLAITVKADGTTIVVAGECEETTLRIDKVSEIDPDAPYAESTECQIDFGNIAKQTITYDLTPLKQKLANAGGCEEIEVALLFDGKPQDGVNGSITDTGKHKIAVRATYPTDARTQCPGVGPQRSLIEGNVTIVSDGPKQVAVTIMLDVWPRVAWWVVWLLSFAAVIIAAGLSLVWLWFLNRKFSTMPSARNYWAFQCDITIVGGRARAVSITSESAPIDQTSVRLSDLRNAEGDRSSIGAFSTRLVRRLGPINRPFDEVSAVVEGERQLLEQLPAHPRGDDQIAARLFLLISKSESASGIEQFLRGEILREAARALLELVLSADNAHELLVVYRPQTRRKQLAVPFRTAIVLMARRRDGTDSARLPGSIGSEGQPTAPAGRDIKASEPPPAEVKPPKRLLTRRSDR